MIDNSVEYILCAAYKLPEDFMYPNIEKINKSLNEHEASMNGTPVQDVRDTYFEPHRQVFHMALGWRHPDILWKYGKHVCKSKDSGFMTSKGRFVDRDEGMKLAFISGQVPFNRAILKTGDNNDGFWDVIEQEVKDGMESNWSTAQRKLIAENVKEWITLYSEDLY